MARDGFRMSVNTAGLDSLLRDLGDGIDDAIRPAAQAGAQVIYDAAKANAQRLGRVSGRLAASVYQAYSSDNSAGARATYHVAWRAKGGRGKTLPNSAPHAHFIEYGHWRYYQTVQDARGQWRMAVRPEMQGKPPPKGDRRTNRAGLDAYYIPLPAPVWVPPQPFMRAAYAAKSGAAAEAAQDVIFKRIDDSLAKK